MSRRARHDDDDEDLTQADRQAIAAIRRQLDAEFGPLERAQPLAAEPEPAPAPAVPRRSPAPAAARSSPHPRVRTTARAVPLFLIGTLVGGAVGGITGGLTTLAWLHYAGDPSAGATIPGERSARPPGPSIERGAGASDEPAAATREGRLRPADAIASAVSEWLEATKDGDIERQMRFYPARVPVYYTWRDVSREAVRAEKLRVFGAATRLEITTDTPIVEVTDDGDRAVTRFRKRYVIEGPNVRRRGEVIQELRWARTPDGWRIVAERDAEVLAPSASVGPGGAKRGGTIDPAR